MSASLDTVEQTLRQALDDLAYVRAQMTPDEVALIQAEQAALADRVQQLDIRIAGLRGWSPTQPGDWAIAREVARWQGFDKKHSWSKGEAEVWGQNQEPFTAAVMTSVLGDNWTHVVALTRKAASLTPTERSDYRTAWLADYNAHKGDYDQAWRAVVVGGGPGGAVLRALGAFVVLLAGVGSALARRSEVETKYYDVRTRVWRRMFGPIHPDDPAVV